MTEALLSIRWAELVDLVVVWLMVWAGIAWLRATPARLALAGLGILAVIYLVARQLGLVLTTWILQGFAAVSVLVGVVVFQQDLRRLFEQIAALSLRRRLSSWICATSTTARDCSSDRLPASRLVKSPYTQAS